MKTAIFGLTLGLLAVGGLIASGVFMTHAYATTVEDPTDPINAATASNSDDDSVTQSNSASINQEAHVKCKASVSDDDGVQVGDNTNTAANGCYSEQTAANVQTNTNTDNDVQTAIATACQSIAGLAGTNLCANTESDDEEM